MEALTAYYEDQLQVIRKRKAEVCADVRAARKRAKRQHPQVQHVVLGTTSASSSTQSGSATRISQTKMWMLLMVYVLANHRVEVAVAYAMGQGRGRRFELVGAADQMSTRSAGLEASIENAYIQTTKEHLLEMFTNSTFFGTLGRILLACRFVMEYDLFQWLVTQNCDRGVAPGFALLCEKARSFVPLCAPSSASVEWDHILSHAGQRSSDWLRSFRRRWHAKADGKLGLGPDLTGDELKKKACISDCTLTRGGPIPCPKKNGPQGSKNICFGYPETGPKLVPQNRVIACCPKERYEGTKIRAQVWYPFLGHRSCVFKARLQVFGNRNRSLRDAPEQATAYFQWANFASAQSCKPVLFINMDETAIAYSYPNQRGTVISRKWLPRGRGHKQAKKHKKGERGHVTYMSFIASDSVVQACLPQILLGNPHFFTLKELQVIAPMVPANVYLWREKSSWNNHKIMRRALTTLHKHLAAHLEEFNVVFVLDVHSSHMHRSISLLARRLGIQLLYVTGLVLDNQHNVCVVIHQHKALLVYLTWRLVFCSNARSQPGSRGFCSPLTLTCSQNLKQWSETFG
jgi:hypothetical protein